MATTHIRVVRDPLEPLVPQEFKEIVAALKRWYGAKRILRFSALDLVDPPKEEVLAWDAQRKGSSKGNISSFSRRAKFVVIVEEGVGSYDSFEGLVSLEEGREVRVLEETVKKIEHGQPAFQIDEFSLVEECVKRDPRVIEALRRRGITDLSLLMVDPGSCGNFGFPYELDENGKQRRLSQALLFTRMGDPNDNGYAHPIDGLVPIVDVNALKVIHIEEHDTDPIPKADGNYSRKFIPQRAPNDGLPLKPLAITQPEGPSFKVDGNRVSWDRWNFRVGFNAREGLILYTMTYGDRPVVYRASLAEMTVPYGDPRAQHFRKNAFDGGEYGLGRCANSLKLGCDCLGEIYYFDTSMIDSRGEVIFMKNAVCMHEEDFGILWKHMDWRTGDVELRRSRRLVVSFFTTVGNYEYGFYYNLYLDGRIQFEIKLTGIINTGHHDPRDPPRFGTMVGPDGLYGLTHQHFFCFRLDMSVDGHQNNSVYEINTQGAPPDPKENPQKNAFYASATPLDSESKAKRNIDPFSARCWRIENPSIINPVTNKPVGYVLDPGANCLPFAHESAVVMQRADYLRHNLHVTRYHPDELYPAGDYCNQHAGFSLPGSGLPEYTKADRSLVNTNVVLWYTVGKTHVVRPEDWPVMPCAYIDFDLKPSGFFTRNPAIDLPPERAERSECASKSSCCQPPKIADAHLLASQNHPKL